MRSEAEIKAKLAELDEKHDEFWRQVNRGDIPEAAKELLLDLDGRRIALNWVLEEEAAL